MCVSVKFHKPYTGFKMWPLGEWPSESILMPPGRLCGTFPKKIWYLLTSVCSHLTAHTTSTHICLLTHLSTHICLLTQHLLTQRLLTQHLFTSVCSYLSPYICLFIQPLPTSVYSHNVYSCNISYTTSAHICMLTFIYSHLCTHICLLTSVYSHLSVDISAHICLLISVCAHLCTHICVLTSVYSHLSAHTASHTMSTHIRVLTSVYTRLSAHKCLLTTSAHICLLTSVCSRMSTQSTLEIRQISVTIPRSNILNQRVYCGYLQENEWGVTHRSWDHPQAVASQKDHPGTGDKSGKLYPCYFLCDLQTAQQTTEPSLSKVANQSPLSRSHLPLP